MPDPLSIARSYLGTPYKFGGADCNGIDCSALTQKAYPSLPRMARDQYGATARIGADQLQPGDLVFLQGTQKGLGPGVASHVGIFDGQNIIAAPHTGGRVSAQPLSSWQGSRL